MKNRRLLLILLAVVLVAAVLLIWRISASSGELRERSVSTAPESSAEPTAEETPAPAETAAVTRSAAADGRHYAPLGNGQDTVTIMIYMCGTDLESQYGMATNDLMEMVKANISDKVNILVETGGCRQWRNSVVSNKVNEIYKVETGGLVRLESNMGTAYMTDPSNLTEFIRYCAKHYPADRNILILWDHGGGSISGFGYDEKGNSSDSMTLTEINQALKNAGCTFDWIGFDACLMATLETAMVCGDYADYLIASEESEPGTGWYYTTWLNELSQNTSVGTEKLAQTLIDSFVQSSCQSTSRAQVTLSVVDLVELQNALPETFKSFAMSITEKLENKEYSTISNARAGARQFARSSRINQVDLVDLATRIGTPEALSLAETLQGCIKYNNATISNAYGISIYFPYESLKSVKNAVTTYNSLGMDEEYTQCITSFASLEQSGQITASASASYDTSNFYYAGSGSSLLDELLNAYTGGYSTGTESAYGSYGSGYTSGTSYGYGGYDTPSGTESAESGDIMDYFNSYTAYPSYFSGSTYSTGSVGSSPLGSLLGSYVNAGGNTAAGYSLDLSTVLGILSAFGGRSMPEALDWMDTDLVADYAETMSESFLDPGRIQLSWKNDHRVLSLTQEEWDLVQTVELNIYVNDGQGFIDLGLDNVFEFDGDDLILDYDHTWLTVDGSVVAYYLVSDTENEDGSYTTIGRIPAELNGELVELQVVFDSENPDGVITGAYPMYHGETETVSKGCIPIETGDEIAFLCDYYAFDGSYSNSYYLGEPITVGEEGLTLANMNIGASACSVTYRLTDIYGNSFWTPAFAG